MAKGASILCLAAALWVSPVARGQEPAGAGTADELGRGVLAALSSGSFQDLDPYLATEPDVLEVIGMLASRQEMPEERLVEMRAQAPEVVSAIRERLATDFALLRAREIDWTLAELSGVRITLRDPDTGEEREVDSATLASDSSPGADIQILYSAGDETGEIDLQDCIRTDRGWLVMETLRHLSR